MIKSADVKTSDEISFEIDKRAGKLIAQADSLKQDFKSEFDKIISALSQTE